MGFAARIARGGGFTRTTDTTSDDLVWWGNLWSSQSGTGIQINQQTALMAPAVMACVSMIAEDIAKMRPQIYKRLAKGGKAPATDHPLYPLMRRPNSWQPRNVFYTQMMAGLLMRGNAYAVILRNGRGQPAMLVPINPDRVALWESPDGSLFWMVTRAGLHELNVLARQPLLIPFEDVLHWQSLTGNGLVGVSKIAINREAIGLALGLEQLAARALGNGAKPSGVLQTDQKLTAEAASRIRDDWQKLHAGLLNGGRTAILEQGLKWTPFALSLADLEFMAARNFQVLDIARLYRVPPHMLGIEVARASSNTLAQQAQEYLNYTLGTHRMVIEDAFTFYFDLPDDTFVQLDATEILRADITARYEAYRIGLQGWLTPNEVRLAEDLEPDDDPAADELWRPVNVAPLNSDIFLGQVQSENAPGLGSDQGGENPGAGRPVKKIKTPVDDAPSD